MKKYLSAMALVGLLFSASIAYGTDQPVIDQIDPPAPKIEVVNQEITMAEFATMLSQGVGYKIDNKTIDGDYLPNEPIVIADALKMCSLVVNPFDDGEFDTARLAYELGLKDDINAELNVDVSITRRDAETMISNLVSLIKLKQNEKNNLGVSYTLNPVPEGYKLELMWGKKPSSGYNIDIKDTKIIGQTLYVRYTTTEPKPGAAYLTVITYPVDSVILDINKLPQRVVMINSD
ncbi:protease complex subunit PrcB family protein [Peptococcaceae bacterium 1198_IL3148]